MERRGQERYTLDVPVRITRKGGPDPDVFEASSRDISSKAVCIKLGDKHLAANEWVHLDLLLTVKKIQELFGGPQTVTLRVDGCVVRSLTEGAVVQFSKSYSIVPTEGIARSEIN